MIKEFRELMARAVVRGRKLTDQLLRDLTEKSHIEILVTLGNEI